MKRGKLRRIVQITINNKVMYIINRDNTAPYIRHPGELSPGEEALLTYGDKKYYNDSKALVSYEMTSSFRPIWDVVPCKYYHDDHCFGTKGCEEASCGGNEVECNK